MRRMLETRVVEGSLCESQQPLVRGKLLTLIHDDDDDDEDEDDDDDGNER